MSRPITWTLRVLRGSSSFCISTSEFNSNFYSRLVVVTALFECALILRPVLRLCRGLVVAVTHDRYFLDKVAGYILEIDGGRCYGYKGNYGTWLELKAKRLEMQQK